MNVPRNETGGAPCKLQCSAIRLNGNKAIACVNVRTIPIENYETRKIEQPAIFARTKVSFFTAGWTRKEFHFFLQLVWQKFFPGGWTKDGKEIASDARNAAILDCWHQTSTLEIFQSDRTYHEYPKWCCFGNLVRAMPDMHCLVANGDLASLHVLISKLFRS